MSRSLALRGAVAAAAAVALAPVVLPAAAGAPAPQRHWVAAFAAPAQAGALPPMGGPPSTATVRNIARLSVGGTAVRIRLSNPTDAGPLVVSAATVGVQSGEGAAVDPRTLRSVTFGGRPAVTLRPRTTAVYSDPVRLPVRALSNLAVSLSLPSATNPAAPAATWATGYRTPAGGGDRTRDASGASLTETYTGSYALTGVDVLTDEAVGAVVAWGSSTFEGWGSTRDGYDRVVDQLARRVQREVPYGRRLSVVSAGIGGDTTRGGMPRLVRDVYSHTAVRGVMLYNINDTAVNGGRRTAQDVIGDYRTILRDAARRGVRVYCPTWAAGVHQTGNNNERRKLNTWLRSGEPCAGVTDWAAVLGLGENEDLYRPEYLSDGIHPNPAGHLALADATPIRWFRAG